MIILLALALNSCTETEKKPIAQTRHETEGEIVEVDCMPEHIQSILQKYPDAIIVKFYDQSGNK